MNTPPPASSEKSAGFVPRLKQQALGLIEDFWKDPECEFPTVEFKLLGRTLKIPNVLRPMPSGLQSSQPVVAPVKAEPVKAAAPGPRWHAQPGELAEKMWGDGQILPLNDILMDKMIAPLSLKKSSNVLDLSAGLGATMLKLVVKVNQLKGLEIDAAIAARGMERITKAGKSKLAPIEAYDPTNFSMPAIYDCMIARELFYRVADKGKFFYSVGSGIKMQGHVVFTDYIVDPENRAQPAILAWQTHEQNARPLGVIDMAEAWAKAGFEIRVSEDQTALYRKEIVDGINRFVAFLASASPPDLDTKKAILREVEAWIYRLAAIQGGMKFYRFHAVKS